MRYPKTVNETDLAEFADTLMQVRPLLTPYPESTAQCIEVAEKIYEIIKEYLKDEEKQRQKESASGQGDPQGDQQDSSDNSSSNSTGSGSGSGSAGQSLGKKMTSRQIAKKVEQDMNDVFDSIKEALESLTGDPDKSNITSDSQSETVKADRNLVGKVCEGRAERGTQKGCVVIKEKDWFYLFIDFSN